MEWEKRSKKTNYMIAADFRKLFRPPVGEAGDQGHKLYQMQRYNFDDEALAIWIMKQLQGTFDKNFTDRNYVNAQVQKQIMNMLDFTQELDLADHLTLGGRGKLPRNVYEFYREVDETVAWITEKDIVLSSDEPMKTSVKTLQVRTSLL
jgi:hypothetical protein